MTSDWTTHTSTNMDSIISCLENVRCLSLVSPAPCKKMYWYWYIYNIGVLTINIEFMWRGLETGERLALASVSCRAT